MRLLKTCPTFVPALLALMPAGALAARISVVADVVPGAGVGLGVVPACTITCPGPADLMLKALATTSAELATIANLQGDSVVRVVKLDPKVAANARAIATANTDDPVGIARLRAAIAANSEFTAELDAKSIPVRSVIAAGLAGNGGLILYATGAFSESEPVTGLLEPEHWNARR